MDNIYKQIQPNKISEEIVQQIKSLIKGGQLQPGQKLPPERTLADLLGVGRSSLREGINILETLGFVEIKKREGIFIRTVSSRIMFDPLRQILEEDRGKLYELYELRKDIELASISMAAKLRTRANLVIIEKPLIRMIKESENSRFSLSDDAEFHIAIAQATHNWIRAHILKNILDLAADYMGLIVQKLIEEKTGVFIVLDQHKKIYRAIQEKDQESARDLMNEHLTWVEEKWKEFGRKKK